VGGKKYGTTKPITDDNITRRTKVANCGRVTKAWLQAHIYDTQYLLLFHYNNGCTNAPQYCVTLTLPVLLNVCVHAREVLTLGGTPQDSSRQRICIRKGNTVNAVPSGRAV